MIRPTKSINVSNEFFMIVLVFDMVREMFHEPERQLGSHEAAAI